MPRLIAALLVVVVAALPAWAGRTDALRDALGLAEIIEIMREEGLVYGGELEDEMFPDRGGPAWDALVAEIYNLERMRDLVAQRLEREMAETDLEPLEDFFTSARGQRIIELELSARRALLDEGVEEASREALETLRDEDDPQLNLIAEYVTANDLVEANVVGAMNSNYAFYQGLADGGALPESLTEQEMINEVWRQEDDIRGDTEDWVFSYLALAYRPLEPEDLEAYIAISETEEGEELNRALFAAFDEMFVRISRALGQAAAQFMLSQEL